MNALHSALTAAVASVAAGCNEIVGFQDPCPGPGAKISPPLPDFVRGPPTAGPSLTVDVRSVDGEAGGAPRDELDVSIGPAPAAAMPPDCSPPLSKAPTGGGGAPTLA